MAIFSITWQRQRRRRPFRKKSFRISYAERGGDGAKFDFAEHTKQLSVVDSVAGPFLRSGRNELHFSIAAAATAAPERKSGKKKSEARTFGASNGLCLATHCFASPVDSIQSLYCIRWWHCLYQTTSDVFFPPLSVKLLRNAQPSEMSRSFSRLVSLFFERKIEIKL